MKSNITSINKMMKNFDEELKSLLLNDLKTNKTNSKTNNTINYSNQNKSRFE